MPAPPPAPDPSLRQLLRQLWGHLARRRRIQLAVLANPMGLWSQPLVQQWAQRLGIASAEALLAALYTDRQSDLTWFHLE